MTDAINIETLHEQAMDIAEEAFIAKKRQKDPEGAKKLFRQALDLEAQVAWSLEPEHSLEPSRSVMFRSAASLAIECDEYRQAERLIGAALAGQPPEQIAEELRDLLEQVHFQRHLQLRGMTLDPAELQLALTSGEAVGYGLALGNEVTGRIIYTQRLVYRTVDRLSGKPFRDKADPGKSIRENYAVYVSMPRAASFALSLRVGRPNQSTLPGMDYADRVIEEIFHCVELFNVSLQALESRIADENYYVNFMALLRALSPDGELVKGVGFTIVEGGKEKSVALTTPRAEIPRIAQRKDGLDQVSEGVGSQAIVEGELRIADSSSEQEGKISIIDDDHNKHDIFVPLGMMRDIVKPLFEERVRVTGTRVGKKGEIMLEDIEPI